MKIVVIGGGAAGLVAAITAAENGAEVIILDKENKNGKKILATGNGKCNITNKNLDSTKYYGDKKFIEDILNKFGYRETIQFFEKCGIYTKNKNNYIYPASEQATTVLNRLRDIALSLGVKIKTNNIIQDIHIMDNKIKVSVGVDYICDKLIIATGGCASPKTGSDGSGYLLARKLGHSIIKPEPALTGIICEKISLNKAAGVRTWAKAILEKDDIIVAEDIGEIQITDYGVSGIPIFNISRNSEKGMHIHLDFQPEITAEELKYKIVNILKVCGDLSIINALNGIINEKLASAILAQCSIEFNIKASDISEIEIDKMCNNIKNFVLKVKEKRGFEFAQVTKGGVAVNEISSDTMESKIIKNVYFAGEIIDIDGICGGYNLQFAWATGAIAGGNCH